MTNATLPRFVSRVLVLAGLAAAVLLHSGCFLVAAGAAGAGTVAYVRGELSISLANDYESVVRATGRAIEQLQFVKVSERKDALTDTIEAHTAQDKKVSVVLTRVTDQLTRVQIRIGFFGNESVSRVILDKIKANL